ncbi:MAG: GNAT family N-acetyltransferase [Alphaproteobacteria bacterium]|nr:GNAT family N-acetyltransferase [Alphaproteobacteria bacterium]
MTHPYMTQRYATLVAGAGDAVCEIPEWHSWLLRRPIDVREPAKGEDAASCYPVMAFEDGVDLDAGLERLRALGLVSVVLVADPILRPDEAALAGAFERCYPFKTHYLHDRSVGAARYSKHHRYELRRARAEVRRIELADHMSAWVSLYRELAIRRGITGVATYSAAVFQGLAAIDGLVGFGAFVDTELVACHLWIRAGDRVHSHLSASNKAGRACGASYLLYDAAIQYFDDAKTIDFGGSAGIADDPDNGLARFKRGFSNTSKPAFLCGKILDANKYQELCAARCESDSSFFPAYRTPRNCAEETGS